MGVIQGFRPILTHRTSVPIHPRPVDPEIVGAGLFRSFRLPKRSSHSWLILNAFLVILFFIHPANGLTTGEQAAITQILSNYPDLRSVPAWSSNTSEGFVGSSWNDSISTLCANGEGYEFLGVHCNDAGNIDALTITAVWGHAMYTNFSRIDGLIHLTSFSAIDPGADSSSLTDAILASKIALQEFLVPTYYVLSLPPYLYTSLINLSMMWVDNNGLTSLVNLRKLSIVGVPGMSFVAPTDLTELRVKGFIDAIELTNYVEAATNLRILEAENIRVTSSTVYTFESSSLTRLALVIPVSDVQIVVISPSLVTLQISNAQINVTNAPNIRSLTNSGPDFPIGTESLPSLTSFEGQFGNTVSHPPNMTMTPTLTAFHLNSVTMNGPAEWERLICMMPRGIQDISLKNVMFTQLDLTLPLPECVLLYTSLQAITIHIDPTVFWIPAPFLDYLPLSIKSISYHGTFLDTVEMNDFLRFALIESLDLQMANLAGEIPRDTFAQLNRLTAVSLNSQSLNGSIPWYGWEQLKTVQLAGSFSSWPSLLGGASSLESLQIESDSLSTFPSDEALLSTNLNNLNEFILQTSSLGGPLPHFWSHLPRIMTVKMSSNLFEGSLPSNISAPFLQVLSLSSNILCGELFEIESPMHLQTLDLTANRLSGEIPISWEDNLSIIHNLMLADNSLSGSVPQHFLDHHALRLGKVLFKGNYLNGVWNMSQGAPATLDVSSTNYDMCERDPGIVIGISECRFNFLTNCPVSGGCPAYWLCSSMIPSTCTSNSPRPPNVAACDTPPARITPSGLYYPPPPVTPPITPPITNTTCPPPQPVGFNCVNGQWVSPGSIETFSITVPPGTGVIVVNGNLSVPGTIIFDGTGTTIEVAGCVQVPPSQVIIQVGPQLPSPATLIIQKGSNCSTDLSLIPVKVQPKKESCKKTNSSTSNSTQSSLNVIFTFDDSKCKVKWIILGCVLGIAAILAAIGAVIWFRFKPDTSNKALKAAM